MQFVDKVRFPDEIRQELSKIPKKSQIFAVISFPFFRDRALVSVVPGWKEGLEKIARIYDLKNAMPLLGPGYNVWSSKLSDWTREVFFVHRQGSLIDYCITRVEMSEVEEWLKASEGADYVIKAEV